jgi:hypothetical protein
MYIFNGTIYLVSDEPETFPDRKFMTSSGVNISNIPEMVAARMPSDKDMRIISTAEAKKLFGTSANRVQGVTVGVLATISQHFSSQRLKWLINDPNQLSVSPRQSILL